MGGGRLLIHENGNFLLYQFSRLILHPGMQLSLRLFLAAKENFSNKFLCKIYVENLWPQIPVSVSLNASPDREYPLFQ